MPTSVKVPYSLPACKYETGQENRLLLPGMQSLLNFQRGSGQFWGPWATTKSTACCTAYSGALCSSTGFGTF